MSDNLLTCRLKKPDAKVRLICFPWPGAGAAGYVSWGKLLSEEVELVGVTPPGRETRYKEECCYSARELSTLIAEKIHEQYTDKPFFFFGHSMGALLCQEVAATLRASFNQEPKAIYVSGESPPKSAKEAGQTKKGYRTMNDADFKQVVIRLGCVLIHVSTNPELMKIYLPALRADLSVVEDIKFDLPTRLLQDPLSCPLSVFEAVEDNDFDFQGWKRLTRGSFSVKQLVGARFYLKDPYNQKVICDIINADVAALSNHCHVVTYTSQK